MNDMVPLIREQLVDVVAGDLGNGLVTIARPLALLLISSKAAPARRRLLDAQAHEAERGRSSKTTTRMMRLATTVMWRLSRGPGGNGSGTFLADDLGEAAGGGDRARVSEADWWCRCPGCPRLRPSAAVLVHDEDALGVGVAGESLADAEDLAVVLVEEDELGVDERHLGS